MLHLPRSFFADLGLGSCPVAASRGGMMQASRVICLGVLARVTATRFATAPSRSRSPALCQISNTGAHSAINQTHCAVRAMLFAGRFRKHEQTIVLVRSVSL
jgi:hypothetical protein